MESLSESRKPPLQALKESSRTKAEIISSTNKVNIPKESDSKYAWTPGILNRWPWAAAAALTAVLICAAACIAVLKLSYLQEVERWVVAPAVLLAIFSAVANTSLRLALTEGINVAWWHQVSKAGSIRDLHAYWTCGRASKQRFYLSVSLISLLWLRLSLQLS